MSLPSWSWEAHPTTLVRLPWSSRRHWHYCFSNCTVRALVSVSYFSDLLPPDRLSHFQVPFHAPIPGCGNGNRRIVWAHFSLTSADALSVPLHYVGRHWGRSTGGMAPRGRRKS